MNTDIIDIYSDGACKGNPGPGGWGALMVVGDKRREICGGESNTTNNRMEMTAVIRALEQLKKPSHVRVHTDSQYVQKGISEWMAGWKRRNWRTADGKAVKNQDLWRELDTLNTLHTIEWKWVRGHNGHPENERADALANQGIAGACPQSLILS